MNYAYPLRPSASVVHGSWFFISSTAKLALKRRYRSIFIR